MTTQQPCSGKVKFAMEKAIQQEDLTKMTTLLVKVHPDTEISRSREPLLIYAVNKGCWKAMKLILETDERPCSHTLDEALRLVIEQVATSSQLDQVKQLMFAGACLRHSISHFWTKNVVYNRRSCRLMLETLVSPKNCPHSLSHRQASVVLMNDVIRGYLKSIDNDIVDQYQWTKNLLQMGADVDSFCESLKPEGYAHTPFGFRTLALLVRAGNTATTMLCLKKSVSGAYSRSSKYYRENWLRANDDKLKQFMYLHFYAENCSPTSYTHTTASSDTHMACVAYIPSVNVKDMECSEICQTYHKLRKKPKPLRDLCRAKVRSNLRGPNVFYCLQQIEDLPVGLKNIISMKDWSLALEREDL